MRPLLSSPQPRSPRTPPLLHAKAPVARLSDKHTNKPSASPQPLRAASFVANDTASPAGMAAALAAIVAVAAEQMGGDAMRSHFQIDHVELTARVLPLQACLLLAAAPFLDKLLVGSYPHQFEFHVPSMARGLSLHTRAAAAAT